MKKAPKQAKRRKSRTGPIKTQRELAALLERNVSAVNSYLHDPRWPFSRSAPWARSTLPKMLRWMAETLDQQQTKADGAPKTRLAGLRERKIELEIRALTAKAETCELELDRSRGRLYEAEAIDQSWLQVASIIRNAFQNISTQIIPLALQHGLPSASAAEFGIEVDSFASEILKALSEGIQKPPSGGGEMPSVPGATGEVDAG